jgi:5-methylcytosine-specific restriction endonuclease McrA
MKICSKCKQTKELDQFGKQKTKKASGEVYYRPTSTCLECRRSDSAQWRKENPEKYTQSVKERNKKLYAELKTDFFALKAEGLNRRARKSNVYVYVTPEELKQLGHPEVCYLCGDKFNANEGRQMKAELDHITPLSRGGENKVDNLAWIHGYCNRYFKNHFTIDEMLQKFKQITEYQRS